MRTKNAVKTKEEEQKNYQVPIEMSLFSVVLFQLILLHHSTSPPSLKRKNLHIIKRQMNK